MPLNRILPLITLFLLSSCFIADELLVTDTTKETTTDLQSIAEQNIASQIKRELGETDQYKSFGFSQLIITKPIAIAELDELEKQAAINPSDTSYKRKIEQKSSEIRALRLERTANLDHIFSIKSDSLTIHLLELSYRLNDTLGVIDSRPTLIIDLPITYELILEYYFNEYTLFMAPTYSEARKLSRAFYTFFKDELERRSTITSKSNFFKHILDICLEVKDLGEFDQNKIAQQLFSLYLREQRQDIAAYESLGFSQLYETKNNDDNSIVGYYFFHKFSRSFEEQRDSNLVLVEFSPYYEVTQVFQLDGELEDYTNQH